MVSPHGQYNFPLPEQLAKPKPVAVVLLGFVKFGAPQQYNET